MNDLVDRKPARLRVLLVPDSIYWVTGTIAKSIARFNPWIEATIASGSVIDSLFESHPELIKNFDLVHFVCPYASRRWLPEFRKVVPCVTSHHHVSNWELLKHNLEGDAIVVGSNEWAEDLRVRAADMTRVFCLPYGVDADAFRSATAAERLAIRARLKISKNAAVVGFFGKNSSNDDDRKGIDVFTEAIVNLNGRASELTVLIVGPGWKDLVDSLRAAGVRCVWHPFVCRQDELAKMYHALDFYWVTARVEGGPVTLLEAMSSEVCCLTTPVGLAREIVSDGENALLLPFNDAGAFTERTASLVVDGETRARLGHAARKTILETMHVGITTRRVREVYGKASSVARERLGKPGFQFDYLEQSSPQLDGLKGHSETIPLGGFPSEAHARVRMIETLAWSEHLILYHRQNVVALKLILRTWVQNPFSLRPPRVLLRRFFPAAIVARVVRIKNRSRRQKILADYSPAEKA
jgi:glycosyltransferase involved in cell wall biosynthesis